MDLHDLGCRKHSFFKTPVCLNKTKTRVTRKLNYRILRNSVFSTKFYFYSAFLRNFVIVRSWTLLHIYSKISI